MIALTMMTLSAFTQGGPSVTNGGFEKTDPATNRPVGWSFDIGKGARPGVEPGTDGTIGLD